MRENIVVISFSEINKDSRVKRQVQILKNTFNIILFTYGEINLSNIETIKIKKEKNFLSKLLQTYLFITGQYRKYTSHRFSYKKILKVLKKRKIKAFILNDCFSWPIIDFVDPEKCIIDAHEYSPEEFTNSIFWKLFKKKYKNWASNYVIKAKARFSVERNICKKWETFSGKKFIEIRNTSKFYNIKNYKKLNYPLKIVHHGVANKHRKIENMIEAIIKCQDLYEGYFYLDIKSNNLDKKLKHITKYSNVKILEPVDESKLILTTSKYDLAILSIYPSNFNYQYCLPNKLFQFIQSRLPIVAGPTPSIAEIINKYKIGVVANSFSILDLKKAIISLSFEDLYKMRLNCDIAAQDLCWEKESLKLFKSINKL